MYVHIPFCENICPYCDFYSIVANDGSINSYVGALNAEMLSRAEYYARYSFDSVYLGGGTPSRLNADHTALVIESIRSNFNIDTDAEVSIECNPSSVDYGKFAEYIQMGINRISLGFQSFDEKCLKTLGRIHSPGTARETFAAAREAGFDNINIDLIYGIPGQLSKQWRSDLLAAVELNPDHISAYNLIIEQNTPFGELYGKGELDLPSEDEQRDMYRSLIEITAKNDFYRYELSNFSKAGKECVHNLKYWRNRPYLGLGPSAVSYDGETRMKNLADLDRYFDLIYSGKSAAESGEKISRENAIEERIMMGLRLSEGLSLEGFKREFGYDLAAVRESQVNLLVRQGFLSIEGDRMKITSDGLFISDEITVKLI